MGLVLYRSLESVRHCTWERATGKHSLASDTKQPGSRLFAFSLMTASSIDAPVGSLGIMLPESLMQINVRVGWACNIAGTSVSDSGEP
jgi:hypothetical protein